MGFAEKNLRRMVQFAEVFPDGRILQSLIAKLGWTHFQRIIYLDDPLKRDFYAEMCRIERWSTRTLEKKISGMLVPLGYAMRSALCLLSPQGRKAAPPTSRHGVPLHKLARGVAIIMFARARLEGKNGEQERIEDKPR